MEAVSTTGLNQGHFEDGVIKSAYEVVCTLHAAHELRQKCWERESGHRNVEDIVQSEELFALQALEEDAATLSTGGVLGDVETCAVQFSRIQELERAMKEVKEEKELLAVE